MIPQSNLFAAILKEPFKGIMATRPSTNYDLITVNYGDTTVMHFLMRVVLMSYPHRETKGQSYPAALQMLYKRTGYFAPTIALHLVYNAVVLS
jgi:hypothetical protein